MFKELKKDMEKVREMMCEQNGTINRDFKNLKRNSGRSQDGRGIGRETTFSHTNSSKEQLNAEQISQNNF